MSAGRFVYGASSAVTILAAVAPPPAAPPEAEPPPSAKVEVRDVIVSIDPVEGAPVVHVLLPEHDPAVEVLPDYVYTVFSPDGPAPGVEAKDFLRDNKRYMAWLPVSSPDGAAVALAITVPGVPAREGWHVQNVRHFAD